MTIDADKVCVWNVTTIGGLLVSAVTGVGYLIGRVFTSERQIALLTDSLKHRDATRDKEVKEQREDIREIRQNVMRLQERK